MLAVLESVQSVVDTALDVVVVCSFFVVAAFLIAEIRLITKAVRMDPTVIALRERRIAAWCRGFGVGVFMVLILNRMLFDVLSVDAIAFSGFLAVMALATPAIRFVRQWVTHGFTQQPPSS